ncbi:MAG: ATP-dependent DNA helicase RecG [Angustibacter sp.]
MADTQDGELATDVARRVGPKAGAALATLGVRTVGDLLRHFPRRYVERGQVTDLAELPDGEHVTVLARVQTVQSHAMRGRPGWRVVVVIGDGRERLDLVFFAPRRWQRDRITAELAVGTLALFSGKVSRYQGRRQLAHPMYDILDDPSDSGTSGDGGTSDDAAEAARELAQRPIPIYPAAAGIQSWQIRAAVDVVLATLPPLPEPLPAAVRHRHDLMDARTAIRAVHAPATIAQAHAARHRWRFEEAFVLQTALLRRRAAFAHLAAIPRRASPDGVLAAFDARLPFPLTGGQHAVGDQIAADLAGDHPMHRLLQGEVGSGKTLVALRAMLTVVDAGGQAALLAPTEVLAVQHHRSIVGMLGDLAERGLLGGGDVGTRVALLTGSQSAATRRRQLLEIASGEAGIVVGTHALLDRHVTFADLGLVVVDEQHRFGVEQRDALRAKAAVPAHLLVMTATPIPRTVAMTVFGDLETSVLDELPPGRSPITTHVVPADHPRWLARMWQRVGEEVAAGRQAFVVCPRIGGDEPGGQVASGASSSTAGPAVQDGHDVVQGRASQGGESQGGESQDGMAAVLDVLPRLLAEPALAGVRVEALHGRMPAEDRDAVMAAFARGQVQVLVATTVVEVGVDVPNATVMVVLDADRFGISQLHQLRGRIGRGQHPGLALLVTEAAPGSPARERLDAVAATTDGFELARVDLEQRREGDVLGTDQSGFRSSLKLLRVLRDEQIIEVARQEALATLDDDPELDAHRQLAIAVETFAGSGRDVYLERG